MSFVFFVFFMCLGRAERNEQTQQRVQLQQQRAYFEQLLARLNLLATPSGSNTNDDVAPQTFSVASGGAALAPLSDVGVFLVLPKRISVRVSTAVRHVSIISFGLFLVNLLIILFGL